MIAVLNALQAKIAANATLSALLAAHYPDQPLKHLFGFKKALKATDYPIISYIAAKAVYPEGRAKLLNEFSVSLVLGINDDRFFALDGSVLADDRAGDATLLMMAGLQVSSAVVELIITDLQNSSSFAGFYINSAFTVFPELPPAFPFFNTEIIFSLAKNAR